MALTVRIKGNASHLEKTLKSANVKLGSLAKSAAGFGLKLGAIGAAIAGIGSATAGLQKLGDFIKSSSAAASDFEQLTVQFEVLTKSAKTAADLLAEMRKEAQKSPLTTSDYAEAGKLLMTFGLAADEIMPTLKMLGDVSMGNSDRFSGLTLALGQTIQKTKLAGQEVNQFSERGLNPLRMIAKRTGETITEVGKRMEAGRVGSGEVIQAFRDATGQGGLFYQAIQRGAETTAGKMAQFADSVDSLKIAFGTGLNEGVKAAADSLSNDLSTLEGTFTKMGIVAGRAISDGIKGDMEGFTDIGLVVGRVIAEGIKIGLKGAIVEGGNSILQLAEQYTPGGYLARKGTGSQTPFSGYTTANKDEYLKTSMQDAVDAIMASIRDKYAPVGVSPSAQRLYDQGSRSDSPGMTEDMRRMLKVLEDINRKTAPIKY